MNNLTEKQLIQNYIDGDSKAIERLIYQHKDRIFTSICLLVKDKYIAEDIFQDAFIKVIDTLKNKKYNDEGKFVHWVIRIAHNLCIDHFRKTKNKGFVKSSDGQDIFDRVGFAAAPANYNIEQAQTHKTVGKLLDKLPAEQREVIILRHYADMSFAQIAALNKCSINTALGRMRYGLINLRKMTKEKQVAF